MSSNPSSTPSEPQLARAENGYRRFVNLLANALRNLRRALRRSRRLFSLDFTYPGVYVDEIPGGVNPIPGVPTSMGSALCAPLSFVEFRLKEASPQQLKGGTDICCSVEVSCGGFRGRVKSVWFGRDKINRFLSELEDLETKREGSVCLLNDSSSSDVNPLTFEILSVDSPRQLTVSAALLETRYLNNELNPLRVSVSFAIDTAILHCMVRDFRKLVDFRGES